MNPARRCNEPRKAQSLLKLLVLLSGALFSFACTGRIGDKLTDGEGLAFLDGGSADPGSNVDTSMPEGGLDLPADDVPVDFERDIEPILGDNCVRCHGGVRELPLAPKMPLNLQSRERAARVLGQAGDAESAVLYARVATTDPNARMPLGGQALSADKINKLRRWIFQGAPWPTHWAFVALKDVQPGQVSVSDESWVRTPIDRFILNRMDEQGIRHSPEAEPTTLIRRVSLDLAGLPPTIQEIDDFLADKSPGAYEKVVDRLLAAPTFGERWGRHWLDQARYADTSGYSLDNTRPNAWRWREWVINSMNQDQPFDQFTTEQIAGDLMPGATALQKLATGFHRNTLLNEEGGTDPEEDRTKRTIDRAATVAETWLGLTLGCTQCHSHPYDNIKQSEFYNLYAFFNNVDEVTAQVPATVNGQASQIAADVVQQRTSNLRQTYLLVRGNFLQPDKTNLLLGGTPAILHPFVPRGATPDRIDLAHWLVDPKNPLTPRVTVNTIWYHLFGQGIVTTLDDFGARSALPSHPELLDWLAGDFVKNGWLRKRLIKEIVLSATYRQSAAVRADVTKDPENAFLWRQNSVRVEAEIVSDSYLAASGLLAPRIGGPSIYPPIPPEVLGLTYQGTSWPTSTGPDLYRRGLYIFHKRTGLFPNLEVFDRPSALVTVTGRGHSDTPLQALTTLHNSVFVEAAQAFARRVQTEKPGSFTDQLTLAFRLALAREPTADEAILFSKLYSDSKGLFNSSSSDATLAVGKYAPAGVDPSSAAAWVATARIILNLDELITRE